MQKYAITSLIMATIAIPAMATNDLVTETNNGCDNTTLNTYDGDVNLTADWSANTINLTWYDDSIENGGEVMNVDQTSAQCTYNSGITLPQEPTKPGYTFKGWRVRASQCNLAMYYSNNTIIFDDNHARWKPISENGFTMADYNFTERSSDLEPGEWAVAFPNGELRGRAYCSGKEGNNHVFTWRGDDSDWTATEAELLSTSGEQKYCWCAGTSFASCNVASPSWIFLNVDGDENYCVNYCSATCAADISEVGTFFSGFRRAIFGLPPTE